MSRGANLLGTTLRVMAYVSLVVVWVTVAWAVIHLFGVTSTPADASIGDSAGVGLRTQTR